MNAIQIKSYLFPETVQHVTADKLNEANEIRRFALTMLPSGVHGLLVDRLQAAYGDLLPNKNEIRCYWLDEENELVGFSTDAELQYAIDLQTAIRVSNPSMSMSMIGQPLQHQSSSSSVFKVYVTRRSAKQAHENQSEPQLHPGVVCDGCQGPIVGIRYKCTVCPDYDLCGECEAKALHREHPLTKISRPMGVGGMRCPYMGGRRGPCGGGRGGASSRRPYHHGFGSGSMSFHESLNNILPNIPIVNDQEQLKKFGEYMKGLLDPFGIDVDYFISQNSEQQKKKNEEEKAARDKSAATEKKDEEMPPETAESAKKEEPKDLLTGSRVETASAAIATAATASLTPEQSEPVIRVLTPQTTSPSAPPSSTAALLAATLNPFEQAASALKAKIDEVPTTTKDDSMKSVNSSFLNSPSKSNSTTMTHQDEETDNGFNLVDIEKELRYINSVEQLKAMGYTDDSGWLTRLVIAKNGNINAVLDALNPK